MAGKRKPLKVGEKFGRLRVIEEADGPRKRRPVRCLCTCGKETVVGFYNLRRGITRSCGCLMRDTARMNGAKNIRKAIEATIRHGMAGTRFYKAWINMMGACTSPTNKQYDKIGAAGIRVCRRWKKFENFMADMHEAYQDHLKRFGEAKLTRKNRARNYSPSNCRWARHAELLLEHNGTLGYEWNGKQQSLSEWATELGLARETLRARIRRGWPLERILSSRKWERC